MGGGGCGLNPKYILFHYCSCICKITEQIFESQTFVPILVLREKVEVESAILQFGSQVTPPKNALVRLSSGTSDRFIYKSVATAHDSQNDTANDFL